MKVFLIAGLIPLFLLAAICGLPGRQKQSPAEAQLLAEETVYKPVQPDMARKLDARHVVDRAPERIAGANSPYRVWVRRQDGQIFVALTSTADLKVGAEVEMLSLYYTENIKGRQAAVYVVK